MKKISTDTAKHYTWGSECDGWHLVRQPSLSVIQERMPPGAMEVNHFHHKARQFFYVLAGEALMDVAGKPLRLAPGEGVEIPPGVPHQMKNAGSAPLEFLVVSEPHSHGDRQVVS